MTRIITPIASRTVGSMVVVIIDVFVNCGFVVVNIVANRVVNGSESVVAVDRTVVPPTVGNAAVVVVMLAAVTTSAVHTPQTNKNSPLIDRCTAMFTNRRAGCNVEERMISLDTGKVFERSLERYF